MIRLTNVVARFAPTQVGPVSLFVGPGAYALLGRPSDGVALLLEAIAGRTLPASGKVEVLGGAPTQASRRKSIGYVALDAPLPEMSRVEKVFHTAAKLRGEAAGDVAARLAELGVESLATRRVSSLSLEERRAVALAEALTSQKTQLVLVEEPFVSMDPRAAAGLAKLVRARAKQGSCVVFTTASPRESLLLADEVFAFDRGKPIWRGKPADRIALARGEWVRVQVTGSDVRTLGAALAKDERAARVTVEPPLLVVEGETLVDVAAAVASAARSSKTEVLSIVPDAAPLDDVFASIAAANRSAQNRAQSPPGAVPPAPTSAPALAPPRTP